MSDQGWEEAGAPACQRARMGAGPGARSNLPPLDGEGRGGVDFETRFVRAENPPPPKPSPIKGEGFVSIGARASQSRFGA